MKKSGLGKGLGALLAIYDEEVKEVANNTESIKKVKKIEAKEKNTEATQNEIVYQQNTKEPVNQGVSEIDINLIFANPNQPRKVFEEEPLQELASSIRVHGVIQPLIVNKFENKYMIIAGERRYRASKIAGLSTIPCIIKNYTEKQVKEIAIIENLQREDLNPIESARAIKQLMEEYGLTQEVVAERIGISRSNIANSIRLLTLCPEVIKLVEDNRLSAGHARCLVPISDFNIQIKLANMGKDNKLSVRAFEKLVKNVLNPQKSASRKIFDPSIELKELVNNMQRTFATKVSVIGNDNKGRIYIDYYCRDDLDRIAEILELVKTKKLTLKELSQYNKHFKNKED